MNSKHVLFVYPNPFKIGGISTFLLNLARELSHAGHWRMQILSTDYLSGPLAGDFAQIGCEIIEAPFLRFWRSYNRSAAKMVNLVRQVNPSVVVTNHNTPGYQFHRYFAQIPARIHIIHIDSEDAYRVLKHDAKHLDAVVGVSSHIAAKAETITRSACPVRKINCGITDTLFIDRQLHQGPLRLVYAGYLVDYPKRVSDMPLIAAELEQRGVPFVWRIAGHGWDKSKLRRAFDASLRHPEAIEWLGDLPPDDVHRLLKDSDILVMTSQAEGLSITLLESMGAGVVPVVTRLASGVPEVVVEAETGFSVPVGDITAFAEKIERLSNDRATLLKLGQNASGMIRRRFHARDMALAYAHLFDELINNSKRHPAAKEPAYPMHVEFPTWDRKIYPWLPYGLRKPLIRAVEMFTKTGNSTWKA